MKGERRTKYWNLFLLLFIPSRLQSFRRQAKWLIYKEVSPILWEGFRSHPVSTWLSTNRLSHPFSKHEKPFLTWEEAFSLVGRNPFSRGKKFFLSWEVILSLVERKPFPRRGKAGGKAVLPHFLPSAPPEEGGRNPDMQSFATTGPPITFKTGHTFRQIP